MNTPKNPHLKPLLLKEKLFPDDENWMFGVNGAVGSSPAPTEPDNKTLNNSNPVVLSSFQPDLARKSKHFSLILI